MVNKLVLDCFNDNTAFVLTIFSKLLGHFVAHAHLAQQAQRAQTLCRILLITMGIHYN